MTKKVVIFNSALLFCFLFSFFTSMFLLSDELVIGDMRDHNENEISPKSSGQGLLWDYQTGDDVLRVAYSPDPINNWVLAGTTGSDDKFYIFRRNKPSVMWNYQLGGGVYSMAMSITPTNYHVVGSGDGDVSIFETPFGISSTTFSWSYSTGDVVNSVAISSDAKYIAAGSDSDRFYFFNNTGPTPMWSYLTGGNVKSVAMTPDGNYTAAGSTDEYLYFFNNTGPTPMRSYNLTTSVFYVAISSNGRYIAAGTLGSKLFLIDTTLSKPLWNFSIGGQINGVAISSDGSTIITGGYDDYVHCLDKSSSTPVWSENMGGNIYSLAMTPDAKYIVAGHANLGEYWVALFNEPGTSNKVSLNAGTNVINSVAISPDGAYFVGGTDGPNKMLYCYYQDLPDPSDDDDDDGDNTVEPGILEIPFGNNFLIFAVIGVVSLLLLKRKNLSKV